MSIEMKLFTFFQPIFQADAKEMNMGKGTNIQDFLDHLCDSPANRERMCVFEGQAQETPW